MFGSAHFLYVVPRAKRVLAEAFVRTGMHIEGELAGVQEHMAALKGLTGTISYMHFPEGNGAAAAFPILADACEKVGTPYLGTYDANHSGTWPSGKTRCALGSIHLNITGAPADRRVLPVPFEAGSATHDIETLTSAGIPEAEAIAILARFSGAPGLGDLIHRDFVT
jgi:hypothetical protein